MRRYAIPGLMALSAMLATAGAPFAGPERVPYPQDFRTAYTHYLDVDHYGRKTIRKMFVSPSAAANAKAGEDLPDGAVLVAEEVRAKVDDDGNLIRDAEGRLIALDDVVNIIVMQKSLAWATDNGNWDYAVFRADKTLNTDIDYQPCFTCHESRADRDYNFTYTQYLHDRDR